MVARNAIVNTVGSAVLGVLSGDAHDRPHPGPARAAQPGTTR